MNSNKIADRIGANLATLFSDPAFKAEVEAALLVSRAACADAGRKIKAFQEEQQQYSRECDRLGRLLDVIECRDIPL
jgi:hypothetical protein